VLLVNYNILSIQALLIILVVGIVTSLVSKKCDVLGISWFLKKFERDNARFPGEGAIFYLTSAVFVLMAFPEKVALASIMILALGDAFSTIIGKNFGKRKITKQKTIEGMLAGIIAGFLGAMLFVSPLTAFLGSLGAMVFEAIEVKVKNVSVDDNLFIPVIASIIMYISVIL